MYLTNESLSTAHELNDQSIGSLQMLVYPNPNNGVMKINYNLTETDNIRLKILDIDGSVIFNKKREIHSKNIGF